MALFLSISVALIVLAVLGVRRISRLPSRYERKPRQATPWLALDQGIDPSESNDTNS
ncbi:unannotated protein [freshwater metagenome]|uniref:Unannotated protein n=1 Tax=freshwater metagenome TaxID=449393 RepID=A0A6J6R808_9ZZZZ